MQLHFAVIDDRQKLRASSGGAHAQLSAHGLRVLVQLDPVDGVRNTVLEDGIALVGEGEGEKK